MPRTNNSLFVLRRSLFSYHNSQSTSMSSPLSSVSELSGGWGGGGGRLLEAGRLLTFSTFRVGAYSKIVTHG